MDHFVSNNDCPLCPLIDPTLSNVANGKALGVSETTIRRHLAHRGRQGRDTAWGWQPRERRRETDPFFTDVPTAIITSRGKTVRLEDGSYEKVTYSPAESVPAWPVIDRPEAIKTTKKARPMLLRKWKTAVAGADTQIGFRRFEDGTIDPFHDDDAMTLFNKIVEIENPDKVLLCGDIIDLPENGKYVQEAAFANTMQISLDRTYEWLADMRSKTSGEIDLIEGNHDRRLQNFIEMNAKAAFGLRRAGWPDEWPVMSLPYLLRLDELNITYQDAYPNAHVWINDILRAEHGTKVNSNGSTAQKYLSETPHISRLFGHTHRQEVVQRTTWDRMGRIRSQAINPGCLCRVDGAVPGVHGSIGANGRPAVHHEDWQQGAAVIRYTEDQFFVELVQFDQGMTLYKGEEIRVEP